MTQPGFWGPTIDDELARLERVRRWCNEGHNEADFQALLAAALEKRFGWTVHREVRCDGRISRPRRIDMIAVPPQTWEHVGIIPALGIETKMNHGLGTHKEEFFGKLQDYVSADRWWKMGGTPHSDPIPRPAIVLYATPLSVALTTGVYDWRDVVVRRRIQRQVEHLAPSGAEAAISAAIDLTQLEVFSLDFDRDLWKRGAAILHGPWDRELWFQTNRFGPGTPKYYIGAVRRRAA